MIAKFKKTKSAPVLAVALFVALGLVTFTETQTAQTPKPPSDAPDEPPHIIATSPAIGAADIDPAMAEITVTFDRDVGGGMSWTGGGTEFPASAEGKKAYWRDRRTCVLPVKLYQAHYYRVGINSQSYQNFRSATGTPVEPSAIYFTTQGASAALKMKLQAPKIIAMKPPNGAHDVDPSTTELRVTFSVPMAAGFSWTGGPPDMPESPSGKGPRWSSDHNTCVLPVTLQPGAHYRLGINSESFKNFQSDGGIPVEPVVYTFDTTAK